ncbi:Gfo/Idh/MocA family protein [Salisediminibacterium halotolerans]|uniref:Gfo/Idh/MocA family protein n=1 Tax=Salisediminibacterium halotolerans TaxID=517425 RepID=UPI000F13B8A6|nr:Gfo/Idh/MocA family oxidoreductase [Salisediminibacterium halotolerans]RLJ69371.1 putative dehydrogenase [Actinophytocola xinjiangensis]RPE84003.1 putative dehydrogenase [Salisediminibacterium halotolerans]TWG32446.1 putative dehydrogenase [Salisediminibacterium halotolerans]GEL07336.1 oxidoreductase [Salisediminibacterium halotolerans]
MQTVRWGIIGCGNVTEVKSGPAFHLAEGSSLQAVMRRNKLKAQDYAERHGVPAWYDKAEDLIADSRVDAVYIATPPSSHKEYTIMAAEAGKPVYVEKPMALSANECSDMIASCEKNNVPLFVAYYRRSLPRFNKVKELIENGLIGDVCSVSVQHTQKSVQKNDGGEWPWRVNPSISGAGLIYDTGAHTLDLLDYLLGPLHEIKGHAANLFSSYPAEDTVSGTWRFANGALGAGVWSFSSYKKQDLNCIVGTKGEIRFSTFDNRPITLINGAGEKAFHIDHPDHIQQNHIQSIVNELLGDEEVCPSTGKTAARTNKVMEQLVQNFYQAHS